MRLSIPCVAVVLVASALGTAPSALSQGTSSSLFGDLVELSPSIAEALGEFVSADIDDDGANDLVFLYPPTEGLRVLPGNGDGTFAEPYDIGIGGGFPYALATADFDSDGRDDLAVCIANTVVWLKGTGSRVPTLALIDTTAVHFDELIPADVDGDGDLDLVARSGAGSVVSYLNQSGFFFSFAFPATTGSTVAIECADVNGDGRTDIIVGELATSLIEPTWKVAIASGTGGFQGVSSFLPAGLEVALAIRADDLDLDGDDDLILLRRGSPELQLLEAIGPLTFAPPVTIPLPGLFDPELIDVVDIDGDGRLDVLYQAFDFSVPGPVRRWIRNLGGLAFAAPEVAFLGQFFRDIEFSDFDGDGIPEAVAAARYELERAVHFASPGTEPLFTRGASASTNPSALHDYAVADIDGDGDLDVLAQLQPSGQLHWLENLGDLRIMPAVGLQAEWLNGRIVAVEDMNGDGEIDVLLRRAVFTGQGPVFELAIAYAVSFPNFAPIEVIATVTGVSSDFSIGDEDGDGDLDLLVVSLVSNGPRTVAVRNDGVTFTSRVVTPDIAQGSRQVFVEANGDALRDVVEVGPGGAAVRLNLGGFAFGAPTVFQAGDPGVRPVASFDVNGDGFEDVLAKGLVGPWHWAAADGSGGFSTFAALVGLDRGQGIDGADLNGDGLVDLVTYEPSNGNPTPAAHLRRPGGTYASPEELFDRPYLRPINAVLADMDGDGDIDLLLDTSSIAFMREGNGVMDAGSPPPGLACLNSSSNSTGWPASIRALGSPTIASTDLQLFASSLPPHQFGMFLSSQSFTVGVRPPGSTGFLCLGGSIGRFDNPGQIASSTSSGLLSLNLNPAALATAQGTVQATVGSSWGFQAWHRDVDTVGAPTSNFTGAVVITFTL